MIERGIYDPLGPDAEAAYRANADYSGDGQTPDQPQKKYLEFLSASQILAYQEPEGHNLAGDYHLQRGGVSVLAGPPGSGKSLAALQVALAGASGEGASWFGLPIHCQFRSLMLQNENGRVRLLHDFERIKFPDKIESWLRISSPPKFGMLMDNPEFRAELRAIVNDFAPQLFTLDPWNSVTRDIQERDFRQAFIWLREVLADCSENPACLIIHHLRKPRADDRAKGLTLANLMSGSYVIMSVPRCLMILQRASDDPNDNHVVFSPVKNNDGELGKRSPWELRDGEFFEAKDFSWESFDAGGGGKQREQAVTVEHIRILFGYGKTWLKPSKAVKRLMEIAEVGRTTAYEALKVWDGRFSGILRMRDDEIGLVEDELLPAEFREDGFL